MPCRLEVHQGALQAAKARLLTLMAGASEDALTELLSSAFAYIGLLPLREVFLAIVGRNVPMDGSQLDGIAADPELFNELPISVKRQARPMLGPGTPPALGRRGRRAAAGRLPPDGCRRTALLPSPRGPTSCAPASSARQGLCWAPAHLVLWVTEVGGLPMESCRPDGIAADPQLFEELPISVQCQAPSEAHAGPRHTSCLGSQRLAGCPLSAASQTASLPSPSCSKTCPSASGARRGLFWASAHLLRWVTDIGRLLMEGSQPEGIAALSLSCSTICPSASRQAWGSDAAAGLDPCSRAPSTSSARHGLVSQQPGLLPQQGLPFPCSGQGGGMASMQLPCPSISVGAHQRRQARPCEAWHPVCQAAHSHACRCGSAMRAG